MSLKVTYDGWSTAWYLNEIWIGASVLIFLIQCQTGFDILPHGLCFSPTWQLHWFYFIWFKWNWDGAGMEITERATTTMKRTESPITWWLDLVSLFNFFILLGEDERLPDSERCLFGGGLGMLEVFGAEILTWLMELPERDLVWEDRSGSGLECIDSTESVSGLSQQPPCFTTDMWYIKN